VEFLSVYERDQIVWLSAAAWNWSQWAKWPLSTVCSYAFWQ